MAVETDQLFKEALHEFLPEFLQLFLPEVAGQIDFERGIVFRDREFFTDFPGGALREPDVVAEVYTFAGEPEIILFHVEVQAKRRGEFAFRMWQYYALLRLRTGLPIFSLAIYLAPGAGGAAWEEHIETVLGQTFLIFRYPIVSLPELSAKDWVDKPGIPGALAAALASLMRPGQLSPARLKFDGLIRAASSGVNEARQVILTTILETFLPLTNPNDAAEFATLVAQSPLAEELEIMISPYEERGIQKGMQQGLIAGQRELLLHLLRTRFGTVPDAFVARIQALTATEELKTIFDRALVAQSVDEVLQ